MSTFAVIGYGYWGPNLVRNLISKKNVVKYVVDVDENRCKAVKEKYPEINAIMDMDIAINDPSVDAVIIVLPVRLHYSVAKKALDKGKHVLVEKPLASSVEQSQELHDLARAKHLVLMVDHTYLYSSAVRFIKQRLIDSDEKILHIESNRSNLGVFRKDVNVLWDLAPHDLSIFEYLVDEKPISTSAFGYCHNDYGVCDCAHMTLNYSNFSANITSSWISPEKIRTIEIITDKEMIVFDDLQKEEKIRCYDAGFGMLDGVIKCWNNGTKKYACSEEEPLSIMLSDFIDAINNGSLPVSNSQLGVDVVSILEASDRSMKRGGSVVNIFD